MVQVRIAVQRPESLSQAELWLWVQDRAGAQRPAVTIRGLDRGAGRAAVLDLELSEDTDELGELMMDLRLLGLQPTFVPVGS